MKNLTKYILSSMLVAASLPLTTACSDDEATDPYDINYVYIYSPTTTDNTLEYKGNGTFVTSIAEQAIINPVRCTKPAPQDITVNFTIDASLIESYNQENGTDYTLLQNVQLENSTLTIRKGEYISADSLKVKYTDMSEFQNGVEKYIVPISMTTASGGVMSQQSKVFLTFTSTYKPNFIHYNADTEEVLSYLKGEFTQLKDRLVLNGVMQTSWPADENIKVTFKINNALVQAYNNANSTFYVAFPNVKIETPVVNIKKGSSFPEEVIALVWTDGMAAAEPGKQYLIPLEVEKVEGIGAEIGDKSVSYIIFRTEEILDASITEEPVGTQIMDVSGINITQNGSESTQYGKWNDLLNSTNNYLFINSTTKSNKLDIDLGQPRKISTLAYQCFPGYYGKRLFIAISEDGQNYTSIDLTVDKLSGKINCTLGEPKEVRYMKVSNYEGANGVFMSGIYLYEVE